MQGFGDSRRLTLIDLVVRLRMRLSEPNAGTWGTVVYEFGDVDESGMPKNTQEINELVIMLNEAQDYLCRDLYEKEFALFESTYRHPIVPHSDKYTLPPDFLATESVFHRKGRDFVELQEEKIKHLQRNDEYGNFTYFSNDGYYLYYEVRGNMGEDVYNGQVPLDTPSSPNRVPYTPGTENIYVGDIVINDTDKSSGRIMQIDANSIMVDMLVGGRSNTFEPGDMFLVETAAQPYEALNLYPKIKTVLEDNIHTGAPDNWMIKRTQKPTRINVRVDRIPETIDPSEARVFLVVQSSESSDPVVSGVFEGELIQGWNNVSVSGELSPNTPYYVTCATNDSEVSFKPGRVEIFQATNKDYLDIAYTRLPRPMGSYSRTGSGVFEFNPEAVCEFPPYCAEAILAYARQLAYMKKSGVGMMNPGMLAEYMAHVEQITKVLKKRGESGNNKNMFTNSHAKSSNARSGWVPPGFTTDVRF